MIIDSMMGKGSPAHDRFLDVPDTNAYRDYENYTVPIISESSKRDPEGISLADEELAFQRMDTVIMRMVLDDREPNAIAERLRAYGCFAHYDGSTFTYGISATKTRVSLLGEGTR